MKCSDAKQWPLFQLTPPAFENFVFLLQLLFFFFFLFFLLHTFSVILQQIWVGPLPQQAFFDINVTHGNVVDFAYEEALARKADAE